MSEPIPESVPTSSDRRSHRPTKKRAIGPIAQQSAQVEALFANPDREITLPSGPKARTAAAPPEIVANVQGSSAGAGSGEFHVYKASRRREYERLRLMDEEVEREEKDREFKANQEANKKAEDDKLSKNQAKRAKAKARKEKAELAKKAGLVTDMEVDGGTNGNATVRSTTLGAAKLVAASKLDREEDNNGQCGVPEGKQILDESSGITFHDDD